jgi:2-polyprenyl-3-methyl-5-hydroxy-6-metoxy-1,4-benzoquinol methylase
MSRPTLFERRVYTPNLPVEEFMVSLLRSRIEQVLNSLPTESAGFKVLDMGCGGQPFRKLLEQRGYQYVSADTQNPLGIVHHIAEVDKELPFGLLGDAPFDFIVCTEVMEHVALWDTAFSNFVALLKPGGVILITCPHVYILHEQPYDFWRPTVHAIRFYAQRYGLHERSIERLGSAWDVLGTVLGAVYEGTSARSGRGSKIGAWLLAAMVRGVYRLIRTRWLQDRYSLNDERYPVYLSNLAVLVKPV